MAKSKDSTNQIILIAVLVVFAVLIFGGLVFLVTQKPAPPSSTNTTNLPTTNNTLNISNNTNNTNNQTQACDEMCLLTKAIADKSFDQCARLSSNVKQQCFMAISNISLDACTSLLDYPSKRSCVTHFATIRNSTSICDDLSVNDRPSCKALADPCFTSSTPLLCNAYRFSDPTKCQSDESCLLQYAESRSSEAACGLISNQPVSLGCKSGISHSNYCSSFSGAQLDLCRQTYGIIGHYIGACQMISQDEYKLACFSNLSVYLNDSSVCTSSGLMLNDLWVCYKIYALASQDISACEIIPDLADNGKFQCAFEFAKKFGDPSACQVIDTLSSRSVCYQGAIIYSAQTLNYNYCSRITNYGWMNRCYTESAKTYRNVGLCDMIDESAFRQSCVDAYNANQTSSG
ncbi:MAG: hypothetical protein ACP5N9_05230 [Candidatus Bilamarchaeum sp.]